MIDETEIRTREWTNRLTGETRSVPVGIDPGWDYNPGAAHVRRARAARVNPVGSTLSVYPSLRPPSDCCPRAPPATERKRGWPIPGIEHAVARA